MNYYIYRIDGDHEQICAALIHSAYHGYTIVDIGDTYVEIHEREAPPNPIRVEYYITQDGRIVEKTQDLQLQESGSLVKYQFNMKITGSIYDKNNDNNYEGKTFPMTESTVSEQRIGVLHELVNNTDAFCFMDDIHNFQVNTQVVDRDTCLASYTFYDHETDWDYEQYVTLDECTWLGCFDDECNETDDEFTYSLNVEILGVTENPQSFGKFRRTVGNQID